MQMLGFLCSTLAVTVKKGKRRSQKCSEKVLETPESRGAGCHGNEQHRLDQSVTSRTQDTGSRAHLGGFTLLQMVSFELSPLLFFLSGLHAHRGAQLRAQPYDPEIKT